MAGLKYDKKWAYAIELDDGPTDTSLFAPGFFCAVSFHRRTSWRAQWETDAAPGKPGTLSLPDGGANSTFLNFDQVRDICNKGWAVANHSYAHKGRTFGNPPEILTPEQIKEDLFWSQTVLAQELGRAPAHFVYPNGYTGYAEALSSFGLDSGSLVGGKGGVSLARMGEKFLFISRCYLDEGTWTNQYSKGDPMAGLPPNGPTPGDLIIDFTHSISTDPASANQKRWKERLTTITSKFGAGGTDEFWSAPTEEVISVLARGKSREVKVTPGNISVTPSRIPCLGHPSRSDWKAFFKARPFQCPRRIHLPEGNHGLDHDS